MARDESRVLLVVEKLPTALATQLLDDLRQCPVGNALPVGQTAAEDDAAGALDRRLSAKALADEAETEVRATGARPRRIVLTGLDSLTASERRIAELAGQGLTNREIGQTLFITARTVEGHLTSVFRKLQVDSRDELPAALAVGAPVPA